MRNNHFSLTRWWLASTLVLGMGCGDAGVVGDVGITCGPGTRLEGRRCVVADGPTGPQVQDLRVPVVYWDAEEGDRIEVNHRLPIAMEIEAVPLPGLTEAQQDEAVPVEVAVFLVRPGSGPVADRRCPVGGDTVLLARGGGPEYFDASLIVPRECLVGGAATEFELQVELTEDTGNDAVSGVTRTLHFTTQNVMNASSAESACRLDDDADERCDLSFEVEPPEGNENFQHVIRPQSNVGVLWTATPTGGPTATTDQLPPNLSLEVVTRGFGNDPNSEEDDALPGPLALSVDIAPAVGAGSRVWQSVPVSMQELPSEQEPPQQATAWRGNDEDRSYAHLYLPAEIQTRMTTGDWAGNDLYLVRVCERPVGWQEDEEPSDVDPRWRSEDEGDTDSACRVHRIRFTRPLASTSISSRFWGWQRTWEKSGRHLGGSARIGADVGASVLAARAGGVLEARLKLFGREFIPFGVYAQGIGDVRNPASSSLLLRFIAMNETLRDISRTLSGERSVRVQSDLGSVMREFCVQQNFVIVVVPLEVRGCIRGEAGVTGHVELRGGTANFPAEFGSGTSWVAAEAGVVPSARIGIGLSGGVGGRIAGFGLEVDLNVLEVSLPLTGVVTFAVSAPPGVSQPQLTVLDCPAWVRSNPPGIPAPLNANECFRPSFTSLMYRGYTNQALARWGEAVAQYERMLSPRLSARLSLDITLEFLSGRVGIYGYVGPIRGSVTIGSWGGIGGFGGGRSRINLFNVTTGVLSL